MNTEKKIISNFMWRFAERSGAQVVSFIVSIVLARILLPEDYGTIALVTVFTSILQVFVDSGLGTALIQKKDADDLDFSSVFYFNFVVCLILYAGMFIASPYIALFYNDITLTSVIRVLSLTIVISGVKGIQQAYVSRNMLFKRFFYSTIGGTIFSAFLGIGMAYAGLGVWALVAQQLSNTAIDTIILWITVKWRPRKAFSWKRLRTLLTFGWKLLISALLDTSYNNLRNLIIGKLYSSADLAFYNQGDKFPKVIVTNINTSIDSVLLPTMSSAQDDKERVKQMTRRAIKTSTYVMAPLMMGLAFCAEPIVRIVLTDKWLPCVPFLQIFCFSLSFWPVHTSNLQAINAMGRSDIFLKLEIIKKVLGILALIITVMCFSSPIAIAMTGVFTGVISCFINAYPNKRLINYSYKEQVEDILPSFFISIAMFICISLLANLKVGIVYLLIIQVLAGIIVYLTLSLIFKLRPFIKILNIILKREKVL